MVVQSMNQVVDWDRYLGPTVDFFFDYLLRPMMAVPAAGAATAIGKFMGINVQPFPLAIATIVGQVAVSIFDKQTEDVIYHTFSKFALKELLQFVVVITLSTLTYDFLSGAQIGACSLLIGNALAYTIAKVSYCVFFVLVVLSR
jgi:hypothetical protein